MGLFGWKKGNKKVKNESKVITTSGISFDSFQSFLDEYSNSSYKKLSAVHKCKDLIGDSLSKLPFFVYNKNTSEIKKDHYLTTLLELKPSKVQSKTQFFKTFVTKLLFTGNAYILPIRKGLKIVELKILDNVSAYKDENNGNVYYIGEVNQQRKVFMPDELIHLMINSEDGIEGISVLSAARQTLETSMSQEKFQEDFYNRGGRPTGTLNLATDLSNQQIEIGQDSNGNPIKISAKDAVKQSWEKHIKEGSGTAVLDNGMVYSTVSQISPKDMDFVSSKNQSISDIARYFNVPLSKLGVGSSTYSSREQEAIEFISQTIMPYANQICETFTLVLLTGEEIEQGLRIGTNTDEEILADVTSRANYHRTMVQIGAESPSEVRVSEQIGPAYELGNEFRIGPNYVIMGGPQDNSISSLDKKENNVDEEV